MSPMTVLCPPWSYDEAAGQVTVEGMGAFLGLAKAFNGGELGAPFEAPASITYNVYPEDDGSLTVTVPIADLVGGPSTSEGLSDTFSA